ncbi:5'/3'-nucleotidase SurE [Halorubellus sp. JP-L1]|uniref:5'/3'-nucleotidase SurE n=1 Tax=Halorubellus sp. JP-L1 TaxID=2715753 RepID=UPI0014087E9A|nr:5'/3'-nucleotidase SurE [Halorubellus sp. JP-L1]NHN43578.1 5'/3'-nucleotidase SurE [Halorubellus sp. JP-L1]
MTEVLLTNDDGIDADGLAALYEELRAIGDVTVVAPTENQSGVGRERSSYVTREDHPWGYAVDGTPADCVAYGLRGLDADFDLVVSGCNHGPNLGAYVLGRSGTVGAAMEAAFLGTPAVAVSAYHTREFFVRPPDAHDFDPPARVARDVVERALAEGVFDAVDVVNVNAPIEDADAKVRLTRPDVDFDLHVERHEDTADLPVDVEDDQDVIGLQDSLWPHVVGWENPMPGIDEHRERYDVGTERRAVIDGEVGVSGLTAPRNAVETDALGRVVDAVDGSRASVPDAGDE